MPSFAFDRAHASLRAFENAITHGRLQTFDYYAHRLRSGEALLADHFDAF